MTKRLTSALLLACLVVAGAPFAVGQRSGSGSPAAQGLGGNSPDPMPLLLRPEGWLYDWKPSAGNPVDPNRTGEAGHGDLVFEMHADGIVVVIHNVTLATTCERDVTLSAGSVLFDACYETGIALHFDAADSEFPFKGGGRMHDWRLKAR